MPEAWHSHGARAARHVAVYESARAPAVQDLVAKYDPARKPAGQELEGQGAPAVRLGDLGGPVVEDPAAARPDHAFCHALPARVDLHATQVC